MSDDLIKRLLNAPADGLGTEDLCAEAADRIEELEQEQERLGDQCEGLFQAAMNNGQALILAEAKLRRVVGELRDMVAVAELDNWDKAVTGRQMIIKSARVALAEIEGDIK